MCVCVCCVVFSFFYTEIPKKKRTKTEGLVGGGGVGGGVGRTEENVFFFGKLYLKRKRKRDAVLLFISGHDPKWPTDGATVVVLAAPTGTSFAYRPHVSIDKRPGPLGVEEIPPISRTALETPSKRRVIDSQLSTSPSNLMNSTDQLQSIETLGKTIPSE